MNGQFTGKPGPNKICWVVELPDGRGLEWVHSEHCRIEGSAAVFTDGTVMDASLVTVYSPTAYATIYECYECPHEDEDDEDE